jgi:tRNA (guanine37-N1)-methyltransferase
MLHFHIISLFPESIEPYLSSSILGRVQNGIAPKGKKAPKQPPIKVSYYNPRDFAKGKWHRVDQRPYGGGPGMVMEPESVLRAAKKALGTKRGATVIFFSPSGKQFDAEMAKQLSKKKDIVLVSGRYEGVDARVAKILKAKEVSIGPYVLTGGELPAAVMVDAIARYVPGVLGTEESREDERVASPDVYTRPEILEWQGKKHRVPKVLLSGDHKKIEEWKSAQRAKRG